MGTGIDFANNPFFIHDFNKLCAVCNKKVDKDKFSIFSKLPKQHSRMQIFDVLQCISDYNSKVGPQHVCSTCYHNTIAAYKFRVLCNGSHENLTNYLNHQQKMADKMKKEILKVIKIDDEDDEMEVTEEIEHDLHEDDASTESMSETFEHTEENEQNEAVATILYDSSQFVVETEADVETQEDNAVVEDVEREYDDDNVPSEGIKHENVQMPRSTKKDDENDQASTVSTKRTICKVCHKEYRADYIAVHMRIHTGERPYRCRTCNKGFSTSTILKLHVVSHSDDRTFICRFCGNRYKLLRTLQVHERGHTGERPYKCNACEKSFTSSSRRKQHQLVHTGEKQYTCELCAKSFTRMTILKDHLKSHAGVKDYACHLCGNRFTQAHSLRSHLEKSCRARKASIPEETVEVYMLESDDEVSTDHEHIQIHQPF